MMIPYVLSGDSHYDFRGNLYYNNSFDASIVRRIYVIENNLGVTRRWQGHKIEQRWFTAISGSFNLQLILVDNWNEPSINLSKIDFELSSKSLDVLHIPGGYLTSIEAVSDNSVLLVMSDYAFNEINDEYRFPEEYFKQ